MKRRYFLQASTTAMLLAIASSCGSASQQNSLTLDVSQNLRKRIKKRGYLLVVTEDDYPPFEFLVNGQPTGFDHELLTRFQKLVSFPVEQKILPWQGLLQGVADGEYDAAITAAVITDERSQKLDFTMPIAESTIAYIKRKDDPAIKSLEDLSGKTLGVQEAGASLEAVPDLETKLMAVGGTLGEIKKYGNFTAAYQDLVNERVDAVLNNIVSLSVLVDEKPSIFELGTRVSPTSYAAWAVQKGDRELLDLLNQFLAHMHETGELTQLQQKWLKITFDNLPAQPLLPGNRPLPSAS